MVNLFFLNDMGNLNSMRELQNSIRAKIRARFAASDFSQIA